MWLVGKDFLSAVVNCQQLLAFYVIKSQKLGSRKEKSTSNLEASDLFDG